MGPRGFKNQAMKLAVLFLSAISLTALAARPAIAKGSGVGIYAIIDQVTFDQAGPSPNTIRISGVFAIPVPMTSNSYQAPRRGYLYFRIPPGRESAARRDWDLLKATAGTGEVVGFAFYWMPYRVDPRGSQALEISIHAPGATAEPEDYPLSFPKTIVNGVTTQERIIKASDRDADFDAQVAASLVSFVK